MDNYGTAILIYGAAQHELVRRGFVGSSAGPTNFYQNWASLLFFSNSARVRPKCILQSIDCVYRSLPAVPTNAPRCVVWAIFRLVLPRLLRESLTTHNTSLSITLVLRAIQSIVNHEPLLNTMVIESLLR